jgi:hypothetical protein
MALFEHDVEFGKRLNIPGAQALRSLSALLPGRFGGGVRGERQFDPRDIDRFGARMQRAVSSGLRQGVPGVSDASTKRLQTAMQKQSQQTVKNTGVSATQMQVQTRLTISSNEFTQRNFRINKQHLTRAAGFFKGEEKRFKETKGTTDKFQKDTRKYRARLEKRDMVWQKKMLNVLEGIFGIQRTQRAFRVAGMAARGTGAIAALAGGLAGGAVRMVGGPLRLAHRALLARQPLLSNRERLRRSLSFEERLGQRLEPIAEREAAAARQLAAPLDRANRFFTSEARQKRKQVRATRQTYGELVNRGYSPREAGAATRSIRAGTHDLDDFADKRTVTQRIRSGFSPKHLTRMGGGTEQVTGRFARGRAFARGAATQAGRAGRGIAGIGRGVGAVARTAGRFLPGLGLAIEGARSVSAFSKGDVFGGLTAGAAGLASVIPGLGPLVSVAIESIASLVPDGVKDWINSAGMGLWNKYMGPGIGKLIESIFGKDTLEKVKPFTKIFTGIFTSLGNTFNNIWKILKITLLQPHTLKVIGAIGGSILGVITFMLRQLSRVAEGITGFFADWFSGEKSFGQSLKENVGGIFKGFFGDVDGVLGAFGINLEKIFTSFGNILSGALGKVTNYIMVTLLSKIPGMTKENIRALGYSIPETKEEKLQNIASKREELTARLQAIGEARTETSTPIRVKKAQIKKLEKDLASGKLADTEGNRQRLERVKSELADLTGHVTIGTSKISLDKAQKITREELRTLEGKEATINTPPAPSAKSKKVPEKPAATATGPSAGIAPSEVAPPGGGGYLGTLSVAYESAKDGIKAIGFDTVGGTSFGTYQIATRTGTMNEFLSYLKTKAPDIASRLTSAGNPDDKGKGTFSQAWLAVANSVPEKFAALQQDFIKTTHFDKAADLIKQSTGLNIAERSNALKQVLWSTSVQHGAEGAKRIFSALGKNINALSDADIIAGVYGERSNVDKYFKSSTDAVKSSVENRFANEKIAALALLSKGSQAVTTAATSSVEAGKTVWDVFKQPGAPALGGGMSLLQQAGQVGADAISGVGSMLGGLVSGTPLAPAFAMAGDFTSELAGLSPGLVKWIGEHSQEFTQTMQAALNSMKGEADYFARTVANVSGVDTMIEQLQTQKDIAESNRAMANQANTTIESISPRTDINAQIAVSIHDLWT